MLVGEVRCAIRGSGSSWKLSGGRCSWSAVTNVSKKPQVRRATNRSSARSPLSASSSTGSRRALTRWATKGAAAHASTAGSATSSCPHPLIAATSNAAAGATSPPAICWANRRKVPVACLADAAAVVHSSRLRCETVIRHPVRTIASALDQARWARKTKFSPASASACPRLAPMLWYLLLVVMPRAGANRADTIPINEGSSSCASSSTSQQAATCQAGATNATMNPSTEKMGTRERRRLSNIFQMPRPSNPVWRPKIHGSNCQSPRTQRCCRLVSTS